MSKTHAILLVSILSLNLINLAVADEQREFKKFCMWKASAAQTIAMNRDIGVNETNIVDLYLKQGTNYNEQAIVLNMIDKIYGNHEFVTHDTIYTQTNEACLRDQYIDRSSEFYLSQQIADKY